jgi:gliding motility-associated-like protein
MEYESQDLVNAFELDDSNSGLYSVYYVLNGCEYEVAQIELNVENIFEYKQFDFPNVITANDDNVNDEIEVEKYVGKCSDFTLTVRDRWGNQVYVQKRGEPSFNGNSILGEKLPEGVYFYKLTHNQGSASGFIHLLK